MPGMPFRPSSLGTLSNSSRFVELPSLPLLRPEAVLPERMVITAGNPSNPDTNGTVDFTAL